MQISIKNAEFAKFIEKQLESGSFDSAEEVVEAGLQKLMEATPADDFDEETIEAILRGDAQGERGEGRDLHEVAKDLRKRAAGL
jgi:Arc/MetJ-type ribon-helix-helix transcriptional regulator